MQKKSDAYIIDTCKNVTTGSYQPGAIAFAGRKKVETMHWQEEFPTQREADTFVRNQMAETGLAEAEHEGALRRN